MTSGSRNSRGGSPCSLRCVIRWVSSCSRPVLTPPVNGKRPTLTMRSRCSASNFLRVRFATSRGTPTSRISRAGMRLRRSVGRATSRHSMGRLVTNGLSHKTNAEALINYYYDPEVAAQLAAYVQYITPVQGAREVAEKTDPELASNPLIFPSQETLKNAHVFRSLTTAEEQKYQAAFSALALGQ